MSDGTPVSGTPVTPAEGEKTVKEIKPLYVEGTNEDIRKVIPMLDPVSRNGISCAINAGQTKHGQKQGRYYMKLKVEDLSYPDLLQFVGESEVKGILVKELALLCRQWTDQASSMNAEGKVSLEVWKTCAQNLLVVRVSLESLQEQLDTAFEEFTALFGPDGELLPDSPDTKPQDTNKAKFMQYLGRTRELQKQISKIEADRAAKKQGGSGSGLD